MTYYISPKSAITKSDLVDAELYQPLLRPFGEAASLDGSYYGSKSFADLEDEKIWTQLWICAGLEQQISSSGDLLPVTIGNHGIHVQRQKDGSLKAAFNSAQHGGCRFIPVQCQTGKKTKCFYTSCGYSRDRNVIYADKNGEESPEMRQFVGFNPAKLLPVKLEVWAGFIFINLNPYSSSLSESLKRLLKFWPDFVDRKFRHVDRFDSETECNWKLAGKYLININSELQQSVRSLNNNSKEPYSAFGLEWSSEFTGLIEIEHHFAQLSEQLKAELSTAKQCYWLFPNLLFIPAANHFVSITIQPTGLTGVVEHLDVFVEEETENVFDDEEKNQLLNFWQQVSQRRSQSLAAAQTQVQSSYRQVDRDTFDCKTIERSLHAYSFQKFLINQILK